MKLPPANDPIAALLRTHFQTEESDAGLRSPSLESSPRSGSSPDAAFVSRVASGRHDRHVRCREALSKLIPEDRTVLALAYGLHLRSREIDDESGRKAPKKDNRNWRVVLRDAYKLGDVVGIVLLKHELSYLLSESAKSKRERIVSDALYRLANARTAFAAVYEPPEGMPRLDEKPRRKRGRSNERNDIRSSIFDGMHGREIGG